MGKMGNSKHFWLPSIFSLHFSQPLTKVFLNTTEGLEKTKSKILESECSLTWVLLCEGQCNNYVIYKICIPNWPVQYFFILYIVGLHIMFFNENLTITHVT